MSLLHTISPERAEGTVAEVYQQIESALGWVPNAFRISSTSPFLLEKHWQTIGYYMQHPVLSFPLLASIRLLVSDDRQCGYCVDLNTKLLAEQAGWTLDQVAALRRDWQSAPLSEREKALLGFALKAVRQPLTVGKADLDALRTLGWGDAEILDATYHGASQLAGDTLYNAFKIERDF